MTGKALIVARTLRDAHDMARTLEIPRGRYTVVTTVDTLRAVFRGTIILAPGWERRFDKHAIRSHLRFTKLPVADMSKPVKDTVVHVIPVPDGTEVPQHHQDMVSKLLPGKSQESELLNPELAAKMAELASEDATSFLTQAFDAEAVTTTLEELESAGIIELEGWERPEALIQHDHSEFVEGCVRCDLSRAEVSPQALILPGGGEVPSEHGIQTREAEPSEDPAPTPSVNRRRSKCKTCHELHYKGDPCDTVPQDGE